MNESSDTDEEVVDDGDGESDEEYRPPAGAGAAGSVTEGARSPSAAAPGTERARGTRGRNGKRDTPGAPLAAGHWGSGVGLRNLTGKTCYMNAVIQAVVACGPAVRRVTEETAAQATEIRGRTQALFREMLSGRALHDMPWSPREFWDAFRLARPEYNNTRPQDAPDFFLALRRELARQPFDAEPSPAWASWGAEPEFHVTEYRTCAACSATRDNLPPPDQPSLEPERVVMVEMRQGLRIPTLPARKGGCLATEPRPRVRASRAPGPGLPEQR